MANHTTVNQDRAKALAKFDAAPTPSAGRVLEDATKLVARVVEGLKHEAFEGLGFKEANGAADSIVSKLEKMTRSLTALIEADVKYHKAAKDRAKTLTKDEYQAVILKFLMTELQGPERAVFIKKLAKEHVATTLAHGHTIEDGPDLKVIMATTEDAPEEGTFLVSPGTPRQLANDSIPASATDPDAFTVKD